MIDSSPSLENQTTSLPVTNTSLLTPNSPALKKHMGRFFPARGKHISRRSQALVDWIDARVEAGVWTYRLKIQNKHSNHLNLLTQAGEKVTGLNLTSVDYLGLAQHPRLAQAAHHAIDKYGIHSASSGPLLGNTYPAEALVQELQDFIQLEHIMLVPNGWSASFAGVTSVVRKADFVFMDELSHQSLQQGAYASTDRVRTYSHLNNLELAEQLRSTRAEHPNTGIFVITEGLFSMDGNKPDFQELSQLCKQYDAFLIVDVAHDFGALGPEGQGSLGAAGILTEVDLIVGSFSKTLGAIGGFIATPHPAVYWTFACFGGAYTYATAMSPLSAAIALEALRIVRSPEGAALRAGLQENIQAARKFCLESGLSILGLPDSPILPVLIGNEAIARLACSIALKNGVIATVLEFPVVKLGQARFRLSLNPLYTHAELRQAIGILQTAVQTAEELLKHSQQLA